jgi:hypothetical protein
VKPDPAEPGTKSILETMAMLPSGAMPMNTETGQVLRISFDELGSYLNTTLGGDGEKQRNIDHALRDQLYHDGGVRFMCGVIDRVFKDPDVQQKRKEWVPYARFTNPLKRIINKISTVYSRPAKRSVKSGDDAYQALLIEMRFDEQMLQLSRLLNLHRALLVGYRHRRRPDGVLEPVMDIATPANVRALVHPFDDKLVIGWLVRTCYKPVRASSDTPVWMLWTDHERVGIRENMSVIGSSYVEHRLGVNPWVPVTLSPPQSGFWPGEEGQDLVAARVAVWMQGVLMLKESKSATKQTVITGDGTATARGQSADSEVPTELSDGQAVQTIDMSMDIKMFEDASDHITHHAALDYGMSEAIVNNQGVQSAEARELMNEPLYELRDEQQIPLRQFERTYVNTMAAIGKVELPPERHFDPTEWELQYGSSKLKLDPVKEQELFEKRRAAAITSTVKFMCESRPGLTAEDAQLELEENIEQETLRNELMRPLQAISGSTGADMPAGSETPLQPQTGAPVQDEPASEPATGDAATIASAPGATEDVQKSALNGAQILAVAELIKSVVNGAIPRDAGINTLRIALQISAAEAESLLGPEGFVPTSSGPRPAPNVLTAFDGPQDSAA